MIDTYKSFYQLAERLCATRDGVLGFITPNTFLRQAHYADLRRYLKSRFHVRTALNLGDGVFEKVTAPSAILIAERTRGLFVDCLDASQNTKDKAEMDLSKTVAVPTHDFFGSDNDAFCLSSGGVETLLSRLRQAYPSFRASDVFNIKDVGLNYNKASVSAKVIYCSRTSANPADIPEFRGGDFHRYTPIAPSQWLRHNHADLLEPGENLSFGVTVHEAPVKMVFRQTADSPIATLDDEQRLMGRSVIAVIADSRNSLCFLLAIFNSLLWNRLYNAVAREEGRILPQVKVNKIGSLPIPRVAFTTPEEERGMRAAEGRALAEAGDAAGLEDFARREMEAGRADVVHDLLAALAQAMLDGHAARRDLARRWNEYLRDGMRLALPPADVPGRWEDLQAAMDRAGLKPAWNAEQLETYRAEAARFAAEDAALNARLAGTDAMIDRLVYRLYQLTDEEVAAVEAGI